MGGGSGTQTSTAQQTQGLQPWAQPIAKGIIATLMNYIYPGSTVPNNWFSTSGYSWPVGGGGSGLNAQTPSTAAISQQGGATATQGGGPVVTYGAPGGSLPSSNPLSAVINDPTQNAMLTPMLMGSGFLQNMAANNPAAIYGAISPVAASQLSALYPNIGQNWTTQNQVGTKTPQGTIPI